MHHTIWQAGGEQTKALVDAFAGIPSLYIADGHHRAASAARARAELAGTPAGAGDAATFIAVAFPDNQMQILPYNRTVKDLAGATAAAVPGGPEAARSRQRRARRRRPRQGQVSMYLDGQWYTLDLAASAPADGSRAASLDVARLQSAVLEPILRIGDIRTDKRIDFVGGARGSQALEQAVDSGKAAVAFALFPVTVEDLIAISDAGSIMPPKSTWFEPKLRDGLLVHEIELSAVSYQLISCQLRVATVPGWDNEPVG